MTPQKTNAIRKEIERGEKALKAAQLLLENGLYEDAISRASYATLHLAKAALLSHGVRTSSHKSVLSMFGRHLIEKNSCLLILRKFLQRKRKSEKWAITMS